MRWDNKPLVQKAAIFAERAHAGQKRKFSGAPYFTHCENVVLRVLGAGYTDQNLLAAAYLHDVVEDCPTIGLDTIKSEFNATVASYVEKLTKGGTLKQTVAKLTNAYPEVKAIKLADLLDNMSTIDEATDLAWAERWLQGAKVKIKACAPSPSSDQSLERLYAEASVLWESKQTVVAHKIYTSLMSTANMIQQELAQIGTLADQHIALEREQIYAAGSIF